MLCLTKNYQNSEAMIQCRPDFGPIKHCTGKTQRTNSDNIFSIVRLTVGSDTENLKPIVLVESSSYCKNTVSKKCMFIKTMLPISEAKAIFS